MDSTSCDRRTIAEGMRLGDWEAPDGWRLRDFCWPSPTSRPRGSLLFVGGRADHIEKYLEAYHHWHRRGWHVAGFDWRGQGRSGRMPHYAGKGYLHQFDALVGDLRAYVADWRRQTPGPHVAIGHSMGGHLLLRLLAEGAQGLAAAVLVAPMLQLNSAPLPATLARALATTLCRLGLAQRPAWSENRMAPDHQRRLTSCAEHYADALWWKEADPALAMRAPDWGWLAGAYASIAALQEAGTLERIDLPILLLGAERDRLVASRAIRRAAARLPHARMLIYPDSGHELLRESDPVRLAAFAEIDGFLDAQAPRA